MRAPISILFTWNPKKFEFPEYQEMVESTEKGKSYIRRWSPGIRSDVQIGDRAFLLRQKTDRGIVGFGRVVSDVYLADHWDVKNLNQVKYVDIEWKIMLNFPDRIDHDWLVANLDGPGNAGWNQVFAGGYTIKEEVADSLEAFLNLLNPSFRIPD